MPQKEDSFHPMASIATRIAVLDPREAAQSTLDRLTASTARAPEWDGRFRRLVVGFDGSRASHHAVAWAGEVARLSGGRVTLVCVTPRVAPTRRLRGEVDPVTMAGQAERSVERLRAAGLVASTVHAHGDPPDEILRAARMLHADLVLVGASRMPGRRRSLGSIAARVANRANVSVLLAKRPPQGKRLLYATDGSVASRAALAPFCHLVQGWQADADVVHVVGATQQEAHFPSNARYEDVAGLLGPEDRVRCLAAAGPVPDAIVGVAAERQADLILVGARGESSGTHLAFGRVSQRVADLSPCSVLVVRQSDG